MSHIKIVVDGTPQSGGSKRVVTLPPMIAKIGRMMGGQRWIRAVDIMKVVRVLDDNPKAKGWQKKVQTAAFEQLGIHPNPSERLLFAEALIVVTQFFVARPKNHYKKDGSLSAEGVRRPYPTVKPDALKLLRPTEDALSGLIWTDDAIIIDHILHKRYADDPENVGAIIDVFPASQYQYEITFRRPTE